MGGNRRRRRKAGTNTRDDNDERAKGRDDNAILVRIEYSSTHADDDGITSNYHPPVWSVDFVENIEGRKSPESVDVDASTTNANASLSIADIGLHIARGTLDRISKRNNRKHKKLRLTTNDDDDDAGGTPGLSSKIDDDNTTAKAKPTPVQLRLWPALLDSLESRWSSRIASTTTTTGIPPPPASPLNVVGIAPTGTGKTMSYAVPIISECVRTLLHEATAPRGSRRSVTSRSSVHGLILVPTRELAIQVSKECALVCKVANKYLTKCRATAPPPAVDDADVVVSMRMESIPIYGGVDIDSQVSSLLGGGTTDESSSSSSSSSSRLLSLVVAATPGRLLDILRRGGGGGSDDGIDHKKDSPAASSAFGDLRAIVFDEADIMACNADMTGQVNDIASILGSVRRRQAREGNADDGGGDVLSCLVSATLPERARGVCDKWVPRSRVVVTVDSVTTTTTKTTTTASANNRPACETHAGEEDGEGPHAEASSSSPVGDAALKNPDLSSYIPSNIVQTLHVCSNHKKPRKLILTLQKIYAARKDEGRGGRFSANNRLTIVFFAQIKTVKYVSQLLVKEGLRCVELYGSLHQTEREKRLLEFKSGKTPILLATDIAARGIHINNVHYVVNYDFPGSLDQYVHRCGRAGRKEALNGEVSQYPPTVYSFFTREFSAMAGSVVDLLKTSHAWVDPNLIALTEETGSSSNRSNKDGRKKRKRENKSTDTAGRMGESEGDVDSDNDQFSFLGKSILKRAGHVSDAEDSDDDGSS